MKIKLRSAVLLLCFFVTHHLHSQNLAGEIVVYPGPFEYNLGSPNFAEGTQLLPVGIDLWEGNEVNRIYYGRTPSGSSGKPVLVFVHGYASNAQVFFTGEDNMYADVYRDGYRSAYVSLTPNDDMWTNGFMLSKMIDRIKSKYNNAPLVLVGWSKGGVDIDAALVHFGANRKVDEVFTLSSPHLGTGIAELANSVLLSLVNIIFMQNNDATLSLQRGYMGYFRSITDGASTNTVPYTTLGGWGNGPLNRLDIPQGILHGIDGSRASGGNDGVVPYASSIRPGAKELFDGLQKKSGFLGIPYYDGPDETNLDHFEVTRGGKVWPFIKSELQNASRRQYVPEEIISTSLTIRSRYQWVNPGEDQQIVISPGQTQVQMVMAADNQKNLELMKGGTTKHAISPTQIEGSKNSVNVVDLSDLKAGNYDAGDLSSSAILIEASGPEMILTLDDVVITLSAETLPGLALSFDHLDPQAVKIEAVLQASIDLKSNKMAPETIPLLVTEYDGQYTFATTGSVKKGIYQLIIRAKGENFRRDLLTSVAITEDFYTDTEDGENPLGTMRMFPNPANDMLNLAMDGGSDAGTVTIYSIRGEVLHRQVLETSMNKIHLSPTKYPDGLYLVELQQGEKKTIQKLMVAH